MDSSTQASGQTQEVVSDDQGQDNSKKTDAVKYETYSRVLGEKKKVAEENNQLKSELETFRQKEMEAQGKQNELIAALRKQLDEEKATAKKQKATFAYTSLTKTLESEARNLGCVHPDLLVKVADLNAVQVNEDLTVNSDDLKRVLEDTQKKYPELFKKQVAQPRDGTPAGSAQFQASKPDLSKMTAAQIKDYAKQLYGK